MKIELFPTTILVEERKSSLTKKELDYIEFISEWNVGSNYICSDDTILEQREFSSIRKFISDSLHKYMEEVLQCSHKLVITTSWVNITKTNQWHVRHNHCNSFLSGVFYFTDALTTPLQFHNPLPHNWDYTRNKYTPTNSDIWGLPIRKNCCVVFPSYLFHEVFASADENDRISLAFNAFFESEFGSVDSKTRFAHPSFKN